MGGSANVFFHQMREFMKKSTVEPFSRYAEFKDAEAVDKQVDASDDDKDAQTSWGSDAASSCTPPAPDENDPDLAALAAASAQQLAQKCKKTEACTRKTVSSWGQQAQQVQGHAQPASFDD